MPISFSKHLRLVFLKAFGDFGFGRDMLLGTAIAIVTAVLGVVFHLSTAEDWTRHRTLLIVSLAAPYVAVLLAHVGWRITRAPWKVYQDQERELRELQQQSMKFGELSEYDPKVYLDPLNEEFRATGLIPFELSNKGQRVNVAHRITVQP